MRIDLLPEEFQTVMRYVQRNVRIAMVGQDTKGAQGALLYPQVCGEVLHGSNDQWNYTFAERKRQDALSVNAL